MSETHEAHDDSRLVRVEERDGVGWLELSRPKALNALNDALMRELCEALDDLESRDSVRCLVLIGSEKAFAAGADVKEMLPRGFPETYEMDFLAFWTRLSRTRKPVIAGVSGYALGGGCEIAMMCDLIIASESARFGQPEILLGVIPGGGGSQRLPRSAGKAKAMDLILTGRMMDAAEAERCGLVSRVVPDDRLREEVESAATTIAGFSRAAVMMAKEAVNAAFETPLSHGVEFERRLFHSLFATKDQSEGMAAFAEKRPAKFSDS